MSEEQILLTHILKCTRSELLLQKPILNAQQQKQFEEYKSRRQKGEPLQYIIGEWDFYGLKFKVNPSVLVPRPETEMLVEEAIKRNPANILDIGTGSGNIAITLAKFLPNAQVTAIDISPEALAIAQENAKYHGVENRIKFQTPNVIELSLQFDLIISNPPYIPTAQITQLPKDVREEPTLALDGGPDGLDFYRAIIAQAPMLLKPQGLLMFECGDGQAGDIVNIFNTTTFFHNISIVNDLNNTPRIILAQKHS